MPRGFIGPTRSPGRGGYGRKWSGKLFFDRQAVIRAVGRARAMSLRAIGALIRRIALRKVRELKGPSAPGQPPHSHMREHRRAINKRRKQRGQPTIKFSRSSWKGIRQIEFGLESLNSQSMVCGPIVGNSRGQVTNVLEFGGTSPKPWRKVKAVKVARRPFMGPSLREAAPQMPGFWSGRVKSS